MSGSGPAKHLRMLKRRIDFLRKRAANPDFVNTWDKSEIQALEWAVTNLTVLYMPVAHVAKEESK
jgi:hypothetical protein